MREKRESKDKDGGGAKEDKDKDVGRSEGMKNKEKECGYRCKGKGKDKDGGICVGEKAKMRAVEYEIATPAEGRLAMTKRIKVPRSDRMEKRLAGVGYGNSTSSVASLKTNMRILLSIESMG